jgi:type VI protein secretion system component VasF
MSSFSGAVTRSPADGGCFRTKYCGVYLGFRWGRYHEARENRKMRRSIISIPFQTFIRMRKSMKMRLTRHVAHMRERERGGGEMYSNEIFG